MSTDFIDSNVFVYLFDETDDRNDQIPFHKVGSHRRVQFRDLLAHEKQRDKQRRAALNQLMKKIDDDGFYDAVYTGDDER